MNPIKNNKSIETLIFAETFEYEAYEQIKKLVNFTTYENAKVRIMPDAHAGQKRILDFRKEAYEAK
jgi:hypothetical protein